MCTYEGVIWKPIHLHFYSALLPTDIIRLSHLIPEEAFKEGRVAVCLLAVGQPPTLSSNPPPWEAKEMNGPYIDTLGISPCLYGIYHRDQKKLLECHLEVISHCPQSWLSPNTIFQLSWYLPVQGLHFCLLSWQNTLLSTGLLKRKLALSATAYGKCLFLGVRKHWVVSNQLCC